MSIRAFQPSDAQQIADLFQRSVIELGRKFYTQEQVEAWAARGPTAQSVISRNAAHRLTFVYTISSGDVAAYAELEPDGHIDQVYALPEIAGTGTVSALYDHVENKAEKLGIKKLYTEASESARRFFLKKNFVEYGRRDFEIEGVSIHNYSMEKILQF